MNGSRLRAGCYVRLAETRRQTHHPVTKIVWEEGCNDRIFTT